MTMAFDTLLDQKATLQRAPRSLAGNAILAFRVGSDVGGGICGDDRGAENAIKQTHGHRGGCRHWEPPEVSIQFPYP
jgi:hypothetical protein